MPSSAARNATASSWNSSRRAVRRLGGLYRILKKDRLRLSSSSLRTIAQPTPRPSCKHSFFNSQFLVSSLFHNSIRHVGHGTPHASPAIAAQAINLDMAALLETRAPSANSSSSRTRSVQRPSNDAQAAETRYRDSNAQEHHHHTHATSRCSRPQETSRSNSRRRNANAQLRHADLAVPELISHPNSRLERIPDARAGVQSGHGIQSASDGRQMVHLFRGA